MLDVIATDGHTPSIYITFVPQLGDKDGVDNCVGAGDD